ncbi:MAG: hypothetical protein J5J06_11585 [Phycisphaerae bacterium]|nr:hypothetical protein [Phycisphaerae bacterium]
MRTCGLVVGALLGVASTAFAGTNVRIVPQNVSSNALNPIGHYLPGEVVNVNVYLEQTPAGVEHLLRLVAFKLDNTAPELTIGPATLFAKSAAGHYNVDSADTIASAYYYTDPGNLGPNPTQQLAIPASAPVQVVSFQVTMPATPGSYALDLVNAGGATNDDKAAVIYGFGCTAPDACANGLHPDDTFAVTIDRPGANLTGGTYNFVVNTPTAVVAGEPAVPPVGQTPFTHPLDGGNLWRSSQQVIRIKFNTNIAAATGAVSGAGIEIRELNAGPSPATGANFAGGTFGPDLNVGANFAFTVEADPAQGNAPRILRIIDSNPAQLLHRKWYTVENLGAWANAAPFRFDYRLMAGDADNNGFVNAIDVGTVNNAIIAGLQADNRRQDIDGNRFINAIDVGAANSNIPTGGFLAKPTGHP